MKNNIPNHILMPKPEIRFHGKHQLKRRSNFWALAWASSAVAAVLIVGCIFYFDGTAQDVYISEVTSIVDTVEQTSELPINKDFKPESSSDLPTKTEASQPITKRINKVATPPPVAQPQKLDTKLQKAIQSELKREKLPQISISPKTVLATVSKPNIGISPSVQTPSIETITATQSTHKKQNFIANSNLNRLIENIKSDIQDRKEDTYKANLQLELSPTLKQLFEPKKRSETLISKTEY